jgi:hypothetical protein
MEILKPLLEREFNYKETLQVLKQNFMLRYACWGVSKVTLVGHSQNGYSEGLMLKVNGHHHKGYVLITLAWDDTYCVYIISNIISNRGTIKDTYKDVYFDDLVSVIDDRIEKIPDYVR